MNDLCYDVTTPNGCKCNFTPVSQGFHVHKVDKRCEVDVFGSMITDNKIIFGGA